MIEKYFEDVENSISYFERIRSYSLTKKKYNDKQGLVAGKIIFEDETQLEFVEVRMLSLMKKSNIDITIWIISRK